MTDEQRTRIRKVLYELDGIEQAEEMIEAIEYLEANPLDEKTATYVKWFENKFHKADQDRRMFLDQLIKAQGEIKNLNIILIIETVTLLTLAVSALIHYLK